MCCGVRNGNPNPHPSSFLFNAYPNPHLYPALFGGFANVSTKQSLTQSTRTPPRNPVVFGGFGGFKNTNPNPYPNSNHDPYPIPNPNPNPIPNLLFGGFGNATGICNPNTNPLLVMTNIDVYILDYEHFPFHQEV